MENVKTVEANNIQDYCVARYNAALRETEAVTKKMGSIFGIGWGVVMCHNAC